MALIEKNLFETIDRVAEAVGRLQDHRPADGQPYRLAFSGGKDSVVIKKLADLAGVDYEPVYNVTGIDPPELFRFIRKYHPSVKLNMPEKSIFRFMIEDKLMPPTRTGRWCCEKLKERNPKNKTVVLGIRWAESAKRSTRRLYERCNRDKTTMFLNPIIDWKAADVWEFIGLHEEPYCALYDKGWKRIGCVMCPLAGREGMERDALLYPKIARRWRRAFQQLYDKRAVSPTPMHTFTCGDDIYKWWVSGVGQPKDTGQECFKFDND